MKIKVLAIALSSLACLGAQAHDVVLKVEAINGKTHWSPARIEVVPGETFKLKMEHNLPEGFSFHGVEITELGLRQQVNRGQSVEVEVKIPADMKPGDYGIRCHFHPAHVGSTLVVKAPAPAKKK